MDQNRLDALGGTAACSLRSKEPSPYITELKTILSDLIKEEEGGHIDYVGGGTGDALYKDKDVAVQMMFLEAGEQFPAHIHPIEKEWLIIIKGSAVVNIDGERQIISARDHVVFEPGHEHSGHALEDLWHVAISIPADEGYPNVSD